MRDFVSNIFPGLSAVDRGKSRWFYFQGHILRLALVDWLVVCYTLTFGVAAALRSPNHLHDRLAIIPIFMALAYLAAASFYRTRLEHRGWIRLLYHLLPIVAVSFTYFNLRHIIPLVNPHVADARLAAIDLALFRAHASVLLERWANHFSVEWFSACYQSYMYLGGVFLLGEVLLDKDRERNARFGVGLLLILLIGHVTYLVIPARGPLTFLEAFYQGALPGGLIYHHVAQTQLSAGPLFDAFPSLHTASTLYLCLFIHYHYPKFRWPVWCLTIQIIFSTVFLRYHYVIDVIAGVILVSFVYAAVPLMLARYREWQASHGIDASDPW